MSSWKLFFRLLQCIIFTAFIFVAHQQTYANNTYAVKQKKFDKHTWEEATKDIDFSKEKEEQERKRTSNFHFSLPFLNGTVAKIIFFTLIICVLGFILFKVFAGNIISKNTKINSPNYTIADIEENIQEIDLEAFLQDALKNNSFRLAIRIYYLMVLKELSMSELIIWKKDKTNSEYIREMYKQPHFVNEFRAITIAFERVWYGDADLREKDYQSLSPSFRNIIEAIRKKETI